MQTNYFRLLCCQKWVKVSWWEWVWVIASSWKSEQMWPDVSRCEKMLVDMRKLEQLDLSRYEKWWADMSWCEQIWVDVSIYMSWCEQIWVDVSRYQQVYMGLDSRWMWLRADEQSYVGMRKCWFVFDHLDVSRYEQWWAEVNWCEQVWADICESRRMWLHAWCS